MDADFFKPEPMSVVPKSITEPVPFSQEQLGVMKGWERGRYEGSCWRYFLSQKFVSKDR